jgi:hypothetical protein
MKNYNRIEENGYGIHYYLNNKLHRLDGPAIEHANGTKSWYQNGLLHRIDGPAIEYPGGSKHWYQNGLLHRLDGPAREYLNGYKEWYYEDEYIDCKSQKEFERIIKLRLFW